VDPFGKGVNAKMREIIKNAEKTKQHGQNEYESQKPKHLESTGGSYDGHENQIGRVPK
jgi:hypothetical protein